VKVAIYSRVLQIPNHSRARATGAGEPALLSQEARVWRAGFKLRECGHSGLLPRVTGTAVRPAAVTACAIVRGTGAQKVRIF
jgi:hypothetical protein